jgi:hypothetical protein
VRKPTVEERCRPIIDALFNDGNESAAVIITEQLLTGKWLTDVFPLFAGWTTKYKGYGEGGDEFFHLSLPVCERLCLVVDAQRADLHTFRALFVQPRWLTRWCAKGALSKRRMKLRPRSWERYHKGRRFEDAVQHALATVRAVDAALGGPEYAVLHAQRNNTGWRALRGESRRIASFLAPKEEHVFLLREKLEFYRQEAKEWEMVQNEMPDQGTQLMPGGSDMEGDY